MWEAPRANSPSKYIYRHPGEITRDKLSVIIKKITMEWKTNPHSPVGLCIALTDPS